MLFLGRIFYFFNYESLLTYMGVLDDARGQVTCNEKFNFETTFANMCSVILNYVNMIILLLQL